MKKLFDEIITSEAGFYIGDVMNIAKENIQAKAQEIARNGGGKFTENDGELSVIVADVVPPESGVYVDLNGDMYDIPSGIIALVPLELLLHQPINSVTGGRIVMGGGEAQFKKRERSVNVMFPSTEIVAIHTGGSK